MNNKNAGGFISKLSIILIAITLFALSGNQLFGQTVIEVSKDYQITLVDGNTLTGKVISADGNQIVLETGTMGNVTIERANIKDVTLLSDQDKAKGWFPNPNTTRYFFGPTGRNLQKGDGYYQNVLFSLNLAHYGVTDWFSIGGGFEAFSTFSGQPILFLIPKVGFEVTDKFSVGGGVFYANAAAIVGELENSGLGIAYTTLTYGDDNTHGSLGIGYAFAGDEFSSRPIFTAAGAVRLSRRFGLVTENWYLPNVDGTDESFYVITYGVRFIGQKSTFDWGMVAFKDLGDEIGFPIGLPLWISYTFHF
jgi:hypothetical protein